MERKTGFSRDIVTAADKRRGHTTDASQFRPDNRLAAKPRGGPSAGRAGTIRSHRAAANSLVGCTSVLALLLGGVALPATAQPLPQSSEPATPRSGTAAAEAKTTPATDHEAQDTASGKTTSESPSNPEVVSAQDIIVVGTRASLQSAIARKRNAGTVVDSIVADDIASFPDKNVGDSLSRVTGVQLSREFGEGTQVSIRGVEPDLNRVEINGVSQASANGTRAGDFRELATELVKSIDVYKGYTADLTEGGIGGTVSVETRKPLELKKALATLVGSAQHLDTAQDWRPRGTLVVGTPKLFVEGLGVLLNVTYDDKTTRGDYAANTNYTRLADFDHSNDKTVADPLYANFTTYASCAGVGGTSVSNATARRLACETQFFDWSPTVPRYRNLVRRDRRISGDFTVQYEVAHNLRVFGEANINNRDQRLLDTNYSLDLSRFQRFQLDSTLAAGLNGGTSRPQVRQSSATVDANHVVTSYTTALTSVNIGSAVV
jgi:iron complex outermembrane receptor protein